MLYDLFVSEVSSNCTCGSFAFVSHKINAQCKSGENIALVEGVFLIDIFTLLSYLNTHPSSSSCVGIKTAYVFIMSPSLNVAAHSLSGAKDTIVLFVAMLIPFTVPMNLSFLISLFLLSFVVNLMDIQGLTASIGIVRMTNSEVD